MTLKCAFRTLEFALLTAAPRLKAVLSIFDALMTSPPTKRRLTQIVFLLFTVFRRRRPTFALTDNQATTTEVNCSTDKANSVR